MATLPNVPPVPDADRVSLSITTLAISELAVPFPVYGTAEDLTVNVNFAPLDRSLWTFSSPSGALSLLPLPITDGLIYFSTPVSGTIEVVGSWQPRQVAQPTAPGLSRREFNQVVSMIISGMRELARALRTTLQFVSTSLAGGGYYNAAGLTIQNLGDATRAQDAVNLETLTAQLSGYLSSGGLAALQSWALTGDGATLAFSVVPASGGLPSAPLAYLVTVNQLLIEPSAYTINTAAKTITFTAPPPNGASILVRVTAASLASGTAASVSRVRAAVAGGADVASPSDGLVYWNYLYAAAKSQTLPAANTCAQNQRITIADRLGDSAQYPIVITPASGLIGNQASFTLQNGGASVSFAADPANNVWVLV